MPRPLCVCPEPYLDDADKTDTQLTQVKVFEIPSRSAAADATAVAVAAADMSICGGFCPQPRIQCRGGTITYELALPVEEEGEEEEEDEKRFSLSFGGSGVNGKERSR